MIEGSQCHAIGVERPKYNATASLPRVASNNTNQDVVEAEGRVLSRISPDPVPDEVRHGIAWDPIHPLYSEAQTIFDGLHYFNERVSGDLISINSHFNPYQVDLHGIDKIPRIYTNLLVSTATLHRTMQDDSSFIRSSALVQREQYLFQFRIRALQEVNYRISNSDLQTSDSTLMCVICLLLATMQASAYTDWRAHLEGARRIIQLRGGPKEIISKNPYLKPLMALYIIIDVMAATTTPATHRCMPAAASMALRYWEIETGFFQSILAISAPCPEDLFQSLILVNYLRFISTKPKLTSRRHAGTRMVFDKVRSFDPAEWATRMKGFRGWKRTGDGVEFDMSRDEVQSPVQQQQTQINTRSSSSPSMDETSTIVHSLDSPGSGFWLSIGVIFRAAILLYTMRTLILDLPESKGFLYEADQPLDFEEIRRETRQDLATSLAPLFLSTDSARRIGKLVFFPIFICGMEADPDDGELQEFVTRGLYMLGQTMGTFGPVSAVDELRRKWAADAAAPAGSRVTWDDYFLSRPDFIFGY